MEDTRNDVSPTSDDSPAGVATTLTELIRAYQLMEERATNPDMGLPFVDCPGEVLAETFGERAALILEELWARRSLVIVWVDHEGAERALIIVEPTENDVPHSTVRHWMRSNIPNEVPETAETDTDIVCLVPNIEAVADGDPSSDADDWDDVEEKPAEEAASPSREHDGLPRAPIGFPAYTQALIPFLKALVKLADKDRHVFDPLYQLHDLLEGYGVPKHHQMGFVNWMAVNDLISILVSGPRVILVCDAVNTLIAAQDKSTPVSRKRLPLARKEVGTKDPRPEFRGKRFTLDLLASAILALAQNADNNGLVDDPVPLLTQVLTDYGVDSARIRGLLRKLVSMDHVRSYGRRGAVCVSKNGVEFALKQRAASQIPARS